MIVSLPRSALIALLVGGILLASPALLLQFQEPTECANFAEPAAGSEWNEKSLPVFQYSELSPDAKRAFDRAQSGTGSTIVYGDRCPEEFSYSAQQERYEIVKDGSHYILTTYKNDLLPEVLIAAAILAFFGVVIFGLGLATRDGPESWFPVLVGAVGLLTFGAMTGAVVLDQQLWASVGWTGLATAGTLVGAGAALRPRRALILGGALVVLPSIVALPLASMSVVFLIPATVPLLLIGLGLGGRKIVSYVQNREPGTIE